MGKEALGVVQVRVVSMKFINGSAFNPQSRNLIVGLALFFLVCILCGLGIALVSAKAGEVAGALASIVEGNCPTPSRGRTVTNRDAAKITLTSNLRQRPIFQARLPAVRPSGERWGIFRMAAANGPSAKLPKGGRLDFERLRNLG